MRVCHVIESAGTGAGQVVIDLATFGAASGDNVTVICALERAENHFLKTIASLPGVKLIFTPMRRDIGLHDLFHAALLLSRLKKHGPFDIIHGHSSKAGALVRIVGIFLPKTKKVYTAHGFITMAPKASRAYRYIEKILAYFCNAVIAVSEGEGRHALSLGIPSSKVKVIPNGTKVEGQIPRFEARQELNIPGNVTALGFVGRLESQKNPVLAIEALALASKQYPDVNLYMIGEGSLLPDIQQAMAKRGIQNNVHLLGYCNGRRLMAAFDALLGSSDYETLPITFIEALNAGVPIVTRYVCGVEEAIREGQTGFLAKTQDAEGLAEAIKSFAATTKEQRAVMREKTREHAKYFTQERMGSSTRTLYADLCSV
jgi:glycosyltransferase involved in cell wall biosynthesis